MEDLLGFLLAAAAAAVVAREFGPVLELARAELRANIARVETWVTYALAAISLRLLIGYLAIFAVSTIVVITSMVSYVTSLSVMCRCTFFGAVFGFMVWLLVEVVRLSPVSYASLQDVWGLGAPANNPYRSTPQEFMARHGRYPRNPLRSALLPILCSAIAFAVVCAWVKLEAVSAGVDSSMLLSLRVTSGMVLSLGFMLSIVVPLWIAREIAAQIDPFSDTIIASGLRAALIALPFITTESLDRLMNGDNKFDIHLEKVFPALIAGVSKPLALALTFHSFVMWVGNGLASSYLTAAFSAATMAGFTFWAFGMKQGDGLKKVVSFIWTLVFLSIVFSYLNEAGVVNAVTSTATNHESFVQRIIVSEWRADQMGHWLTDRFRRGALWLIFGLITLLIANALFELKDWKRIWSYPLGIAAIFGIVVPSVFHVIAIIFSWLT